jgi:uncharacterized protein YsxB (DUF464 family)
LLKLVQSSILLGIMAKCSSDWLISKCLIDKLLIIYILEVYQVQEIPNNNLLVQILLRIMVFCLNLLIHSYSHHIKQQ